MDCTKVTWREEKSRVAWEMDLPKKKPVEFATSFSINTSAQDAVVLHCKLSDLIRAEVRVRLRKRVRGS